MTKEESLKIQFLKALKAFSEILDKTQKSDLNDEEKAIYRDSAIQRFEFCTDLAWKSLKELMVRKYGLSSSAPKPIIREAFEHNIFPLKDDPFWIEIIDMRNLTSHTYDENDINRIFSKLPEVKKRFDELAKILR